MSEGENTQAIENTDQCNHGFLAQQLRELAGFHDLLESAANSEDVLVLNLDGSGPHDEEYRLASLQYRSVLRQLVAFWG